MFGVAISDYGPTALVALCVIAIVTGALIPSPTHKRIIKDKDDTIRFLRAALDKRDEQFDKLYAASEVTVRTLEDLKRQAINVTDSRRTS